MPDPPALAVSDLRAGYGQTRVLHDISLSLRAGERVSVIGRNGVGKTSLLATIAGRTRVYGGSVHIFGVDITARAGHERCAAGLGYVPQEREIFPSLTVRENLMIAARRGTGANWNIDRVLALFPSLAKRLGNRGRELSGGEQQMLAIGRAMMGNPSVLLMDEPSEGLAPVIVEQLMQAIVKLCSEEGITTVLVEQNAPLALKFAARTLAIDGGRIVFDGASQTLLDDDARLADLVGVEQAPRTRRSSPQPSAAATEPWLPRTSANGAALTTSMPRESEMTIAAETTRATWTAAADNLLLACGELRPGSRVLMINEPAPTIERDVVAFIEQRATALGAQVHSEWIERVDGPDSIPAPLIQQIENSDLAIFNHQMGSMLRLRPLAGKGVRVLNYATTSSIIDSNFARIPYDLWVRTVQLLAARLAQARTWSMTCPYGTNLTGTIPVASRPAPAKGDGFSLKTFPIGTHQPISSAGASGTLALRWFVTSSVHNIGTPGMRLNETVVARVEDSRIVDIEGDADQVEDVRAFLGGVGDRMKKDPYLLNSWHAGINPQTLAPYGDQEDLEHWMLLAHNSPRLAHFHIVGEAVPGELSVPVLDPTIALDGEVLWQDGTLSFLHAPAVEKLAQEAGFRTAFEPFDSIKV